MVACEAKDYPQVSFLDPFGVGFYLELQKSLKVVLKRSKRVFKALLKPSRNPLILHVARLREQRFGWVDWRSNIAIMFSFV